MKYVCDVCGWEYTMRRRDIQKVVLHLVQSGRIFRKILNVRYVL